MVDEETETVDLGIGNDEDKAEHFLTSDRVKKALEELDAAIQEEMDKIRSVKVKKSQAGGGYWGPTVDVGKFKQCCLIT